MKRNAGGSGHFSSSTKATMSTDDRCSSRCQFYFAVLFRRLNLIGTETKFRPLIPIHTAATVIEMIEIFVGH
jgi:hypothetical protein